MRILVTGAARAIGAATVTALVEAGHDVVATARDPSMLEPLGAAAHLELDVTSETSVARSLEAAGELDAIVNNAAVNHWSTVEDLEPSALAQVFDTNVLGALRMIRGVLPSWRQRGSGVVVNVSSIQGRVSTPFEGAYSASKFALEAISESLHLEAGHFGIRVVLIEPGYTAPGMKSSGDKVVNPAYAELSEQWSGTDLRITGGGRPGPETVARAIVAAIEDPTTAVRVPVGPDAELVLAMRSQLDDVAFEAAMRETLGLTW